MKDKATKKIWRRLFFVQSIGTLKKQSKELKPLLDCFNYSMKGSKTERFFSERNLIQKTDQTEAHRYEVHIINLLCHINFFKHHL